MMTADRHARCDGHFMHAQMQDLCGVGHALQCCPWDDMTLSAGSSSGNKEQALLCWFMHNTKSLGSSFFMLVLSVAAAQLGTSLASANATRLLCYPSGIAIYDLPMQPNDRLLQAAYAAA